jgi:phosphatidylglycerol---prolipoprotein diacylglyceryl transferase
MLYLASIFWDPNPQAFTIPFLHYPVLWYSLFFATGYLSAYLVLSLLLYRSYPKPETKQFMDYIAWYIFVGMIVGARLGHVLFYDWPHYANNPSKIFYTWEGGLASHGGALGILIALGIFWYRHKNDIVGLKFKEMLDMLCVGVASCAGFIRIGNFFNQEILGKHSDLLWAVYFGHPVDQHVIQPCHPVQLYEGIFYFATALILYLLYPRLKTKLGSISGLFFICIFGFRFFIEWLKLPQAISDATALLSMGQLLSIPFVLLGLYFLCTTDEEK